MIRKRPSGEGALPAPPPPKPVPRQGVLLALPGRDRFAGTVLRVTDEEIAVALLLEARRPLELGDVAAMALEFTSAQGLVRLEGRGVVATYDLVRFQLDGAAEVIQRRDFVRVRVVRPMTIASVEQDGSAGEWIETLTVNVSGNGVLAAGPDTLAVGDAVRFRICVAADEPPLEGTGRIARIGVGAERAIAIEQLDAEARRRLVHFIFEQERIARRRTRDGEL
jgi:PilZ domain